MPGETIPMVPESPVASSTPARPNYPPSQEQHHELVDMLQTFQSGIESQLSSVVSSLEKVSDRMIRLESRQEALENEMRQASKKVTALSPRKPGKRRREVPASLQVCIIHSYAAVQFNEFFQSKIRTVHASFDEDQQLNISQP